MSQCIPIDSPSREELSNLYLKGVSPLRRKFLLIFHRYVNSTCVYASFVHSKWRWFPWLHIWASYDTPFQHECMPCVATLLLYNVWCTFHCYQAFTIHAGLGLPHNAVSISLVISYGEHMHSASKGSNGATCSIIIWKWSTHYASLTAMFNPSHSYTNQELLEKHLCSQSSHCKE